MCAAMEQLGISPFHYVTIPQNTRDFTMWNHALEAKFYPAKSSICLDREYFDHLLGHWGVCSDIPAVIFTEELVAAYPEAKVVLVERDPDKWFESYQKTVIAGTGNPLIPLLEKLDPEFIGQQGYAMDLILPNYFGVKEPRSAWCMNRPACFEEWKRKAKATYLAHNEMVKRVTPTDRLLLFELEDGWEPLCKFLGSEVPGSPFPRVNETAAIQEKIMIYVIKSGKRAAFNLAKMVLPFVVAAVGAGVWWWRTS